MDIKARLALPEVMEKVTDKIEKGENGRTLLMDCAEIASNDLKETLYDKVIWPGIQSWKGLEGVHTPRGAVRNLSGYAESPAAAG